MAVFNFTGGQVDMGSAWNGGTIQFYQVGTVTPKDTYTASDLVTTNPNPVFLDSNGRAVVWLSGDYKVVFSHPSDSTQNYTVQNVNPETNSIVYPISSDTTLTATHDGGTIEVTGTITLTLSDAATLSSGWNVTVRNVGSGVVTIARETAADTMDGTAANITLVAEKAEKYQVISAESGFITISDADEVGSLLSATGDLVYASAPNTLARLAAGNAGQVPSVDAGVTGFDYWSPRQWISGLILSNDATGVNSNINITAGEASDSSNAYVLKLATETTKQIDNTWVAGDDVGGLFTGTVAVDTWYHFFLIQKTSDGSIDAGFDTSVTAVNIPAGYVAYRRLGSVLTDGSSNILGFSQDGDNFRWDKSVLDVDAGLSSAVAVSRTISVPTDVNVRALFNVGLFSGAGNTQNRCYVSDLDADDEPASLTAAPLHNTSHLFAGTLSSVQIETRTNTSAQIRTRMESGTAITIRIATLGWNDSRGLN